MTHAIRIHANGGPEVMRCEEIELAPPAAGEARIRHTAIGVNYSDVNVRRGGFYLAKPQVSRSSSATKRPAWSKASGPASAACKPGDRVVYAAMQGEFFQDTGAYSEARNVLAERLVKVARRRLRPAGGGVDGEGSDRVAHHQPHLQAEARRHHPDPHRCERRRRDPLPMVQASRRHGHRHGGLAREGEGRRRRMAATIRFSIARRISSPR